VSERAHPSFEPYYHAAFIEQRRRLGLAGTNFDFFFKNVEHAILDYPYGDEIPDTGGTMMRETRETFPDVPPLYVYFKLDTDNRRVLFLGLTQAWSAVDTPAGLGLGAGQ
jgi:hypothetical protein